MRILLNKDTILQNPYYFAEDIISPNYSKALLLGSINFFCYGWFDIYEVYNMRV